MRIYNFALIVAAMGTGFLAANAQADPIEYPAVDGVLGLEAEADADAGWLAVRLAIPETQALAGILWYNNDGAVVFPEIAVGTGYPDGPGSLSEMEVVAEQIDGPSSGWAEFEFSQPIGASQETLYLVFEFPAPVNFEGEGEGGGPAIGYCAGELGTPGWVSGDGEFWMRLAENSSFALLPVLIPFEEGMLVKRIGGDSENVPVPVAKPYLTAGPNPFNPVTEIRFGLTKRSDAVIDIYNIRGARVIRLLNDVLEAGHHSVSWTGVDGAGRKVASGAYFARLRAGDLTLTRRMMLIK